MSIPSTEVLRPIKLFPLSIAINLIRREIKNPTEGMMLYLRSIPGGQKRFGGTKINQQPIDPFI